MAGRIAVPPMAEEGSRALLPLDFVRRLFNTIEKPLIVAERDGNLLLVNTRAEQFIESKEYAATSGLNLFRDLIKVDARKIFEDLEQGAHKLENKIQIGCVKYT